MTVSCFLHFLFSNGCLGEKKIDPLLLVFTVAYEKIWECWFICFPKVDVKLKVEAEECFLG